MPNAPIPENEMDRLLNLSEFDLDYSTHNDSFKDLVKLAAKVAGTDISLINLIDAYTQWTISNYGMESDVLPREDTVCQYTILGTESFEVKDMSVDERFKDITDPNLSYYYGVPLTTNGVNLGALCVLGNDDKNITPEKAELLKIIADELLTD